jgi:hypothetical protein
MGKAAAQLRQADRGAIVAGKHRFRLGATAGIDLRDGQRASNGDARVNRPDEFEGHPGCQPGHLPADFAEHGSHQQPVADETFKALGLGPALVVVDRIVVAGEIPEGFDLSAAEDPRNTK